jgi:hypothetical protein
MTDPAPSPAVPVPADRAAQIAADDNPMRVSRDMIEAAISEGEVFTAAELPAEFQDLAGMTADELARRVQLDLLDIVVRLGVELDERTAERDAALAQLAKVRDEIGAT